MENQDLDLLKKLINDHGPVNALGIFHQAMKECADEYSDLGLKEQAYRAASIVYSLDHLDDELSI